MTDFVSTDIRGRIGFITLTRPKALNALSHDMIRAMASALDAWRDDPRVLAVVLRGEGEKGLCAGGDIRYFHEAVSAGRTDIMDFFTDEYALNYTIATYPKPYIALMDGVVMGGGMGISQGAALRLVTEATRMAMPETAIGLFPDVGGGRFLANLAGHLGEYLGTTGVVFGAVDACEIGLADAVVPRTELPVLCERLASGDWPDSDAVLDAARAFARQSVPPAGLAPGKLAPLRDVIDHHFGRPDLPAILASLKREARCEFSGWAQETEDLLRAKRSPLMVCVTLEQVRRARKLSLADELREEWLMMRCVFNLDGRTGAEGVEGIRAMVVDKDHAPRWQHGSIEAVTPADIARFFDGDRHGADHPLRELGR
ncbi:3-hydroxyisobutyryl-CoA hydrolase [Pandoraea cepalis]|uniref:3-hydroxyisobutyryl-CoA hydrolase n=1 Tax=Pandoraea cepalis TaxID=2508294 RepID=A0AAW7MI38_9BURK|nr:enoyl-CoA hydratase/isomerase family protein [Pandoraea cepalis]MDN4572429.1 3-hydroxyisobutyryl-CoA hydrolase [Pandoraea cepalis]MDN4577355.1 3-hydroxyisobutyryl-CoA hydrolase [Pandoraea cepalis]